MTRPRLLDAYCSDGVGALGYLEAGWDVTGVDNVDHSRRYPGEFVQADAVDYILAHGHRFDAIAAGPPCQGYSIALAGNPAAAAKYARLIPATRAALETTGRPWVLENVYQARWELRDPILLCGRMFGLGATDLDGVDLVLDRHRLFESNVPLTAPPHPDHAADPRPVAGVYGGSRRAKRPTIGATPSPRQDRDAARLDRQGGYVPRAKAVREALLGVPAGRFTVKALEESIPPAYARHVGAQLLEYVR